MVINLVLIAAHNVPLTIKISALYFKDWLTNKHMFHAQNHVMCHVVLGDGKRLFILLF